MISDLAMKMHLKEKSHKKRVKTTKEIPYSHEEAERGGGLQPPNLNYKFTDLIYDGKNKMADYKEKLVKVENDKSDK